MKTKVMIAAGFFLALMLSAPQQAQAQAVKDTRPKPGRVKESGIKKIPPLIDAKAEFCLFSEEGIGPLVTADPDGDGCLWHQEYTFRIRNKGLATAPSSVVQLTIINTYTKEQRVINQRISTMKPGQVAAVNIKFSIVADRCVLKLDAKGEVEEMDESNNSYYAGCGAGIYRPCLNGSSGW